MQKSLESQFSYLEEQEGFVTYRQLRVGKEYLIPVLMYSLIERELKFEYKRKPRLRLMLEVHLPTVKGIEKASISFILQLYENPKQADRMLEILGTELGFINIHVAMLSLLRQDIEADFLQCFSFTNSSLGPLIDFVRLFEVEIGLFLLDDDCYERLEIFSKTPGPVLNAYMLDIPEGTAIGVLYHPSESIIPNVFLDRFPFKCVPNTGKDYQITFWDSQVPIKQRHSLAYEVLYCQKCLAKKTKLEVCSGKKCACRVCRVCADNSGSSCVKGCEFYSPPIHLDQTQLPPSTAQGVTEEIKVPSEQIREPEFNYKRCKICMVNSFNVAFIPCGHVMCEKCAENSKKCVFCKKRINEQLKLHL